MGKGLMLVLLTLALLGHTAMAKNLGVYGKTFPIAEMNILDFIALRLSEYKTSGKLNEMQRDFEKRVKAYGERPTPVKHLTTTVSPKIFTVDPTFTLEMDVTDINGKVLIPQGTRINPFDAKTLPSWFMAQQPVTTIDVALIFIDADDYRQVNWLKDFLKAIDDGKHNNIKEARILLIKGHLAKSYKRLGQRIYFDQMGLLSRKFKLQHIPAVVTQDNTQWKVTEFDVSGYSSKLADDEVAVNNSEIGANQNV